MLNVNKRAMFALSDTPPAPDNAYFFNDIRQCADCQEEIFNGSFPLKEHGQRGRSAVSARTMWISAA